MCYGVNLMDAVAVALLTTVISSLLLLAFVLILAGRLRRTRSKVKELEYVSRKQSDQDAAELSDIRRKFGELRERYSGIVNVDQEIKRRLEDLSKLEQSISSLRTSYTEKKVIFDRLRHEVAVYDERLSFAELGVYEPHFDFKDSEDFKEEISRVRAEQKAMVTAKTAIICTTDWTVNGSFARGQTMLNRQTRLTMRGFNNECEAAIANTRWNNVNAMEKRIQNAFKAINSQNQSMNLQLSERYLGLKLKELHLTHEYREKLKSERDERAELARAEREEKRLLAQAAAAEREEQRYEKMLAEARAEAGASVNEEMKARVRELEAALAAAHDASERARAMAEMTKSGYVYIISNVGSFGEDVVKIGLTRRLDPDDRVRELGDASVPFAFDTHAMIYSDEAPALEAALHAEFAERRINMANMRKEFFRVTLDEVELAVKRLAPDARFFRDREAQDWHETLLRRRELLTLNAEAETNLFPETI